VVANAITGLPQGRGGKRIKVEKKVITLNPGLALLSAKTRKTKKGGTSK